MAMRRLAALALVLLCGCTVGHPPRHRASPSTPATSPRAESSPLAWSGELSYLAIAPGRGQQVFEVSDHFPPKQITHFAGGISAAGLTWSPDGTRFVFSAGRGTGLGELDVMNADGTGRHRITHDATLLYNSPEWSPDGRLIAFTSGFGRLEVMRPDGTHVRPVFDKPANCGIDSSSWSANSQRLVFEMTCHAQEADRTSIQTIRVDGSDRRILLGPRRGISFSGPLDTSSVQYSSPALSPDGSDIVFVESRDSDSGIHGQIYVMRANGTHVRRVTSGGNYGEPSWSPDRHEIAVLGPSAGRTGVYVMRADGTGATLVARVRSVVWLAWRPRH